VFILTRYSGYNRHGEQSAAGQFLILMQPATDSRTYPYHSTQCAVCSKTRDQHQPVTVPACSVHGVVARLRRLSEAERLTVEDRDAIWNEKFSPACPECQARQQALEAAGCTDFKTAVIQYPLRGIVRYVRMKQLGHFMMGTARVGKTRLSLSGSYGSDGLPLSVPDEVYELGAPLPENLYQAWKHGGGWNSAGSEAGAMRAWALQNLILANHRTVPQNENSRERRDRQAVNKNRRRKERYAPDAD